MQKDNALSRRNFLTMTGKGVIISAFLPQAMQAAAGSGQIPDMVQKNVNRFHSNPDAYIRQLKLFTDVYQKYQGESIALREVECLKVQYPLFFCDIQEGDLFAGRMERPALALIAQGAGGSGFGFCMESGKIQRLANDPDASAANKAILAGLVKFWEKENSQYKTRAAYPKKMKEVLYTDDWEVVQ